jgi:hypothetical protein
MTKIDSKARRNLMERMKRRWYGNDATATITLSGGPFNGQVWTATKFHPWNTLPFTVRGETGRYCGGQWTLDKPAK